MPIIAILEDNLNRQRAMRKQLLLHFPEHELPYWGESQPMVDWLAAHLVEVDVISLDHDLELKPTGDGRWFDPGTGREVANFMRPASRTAPS